MNIEAIYDPDTFTLTYVVYDEHSKDAVVIDPVMDYDPKSSKVSHTSVDRVTAFLRDHGLRLGLILETHAHADHLSGAQLLKERFGAPIAIGEKITAVQSVFKKVFDLPDDFATDGSQFDRLLADRERVTVGALEFEVIATPGHTPACSSYRFDDAVFTGDALFMPDMGTGRCDFPAGSADDLYESITGRIYTLPDDTRIFTGHDYQPGGRELAYESTVAEQKRSNVQLPADRSREAFVEFRQARDETLDAPRLLFQSVQVNVDAGRLPRPAANETRYLKIPIKVPVNAFATEATDLSQRAVKA